jgi:lipopolysaccharide/colanic/teichoic acid biosynthesis glycosyltransferase
MKNTFYLIVKWLFDRLVSFVGIIALSPVLLVVTVLIMIRMPDGPPFFTQYRIGRHGKLIKVHKFRTMRAKGENEAFTGVAEAEESRITPLGEKLRRYKLDELPELWDVLVGRMSFVGPRPDVPGYADKLEGEDREILRLRPGITGPATLKYRNEREILSKVDDPIKYNDEVIYPDKVRLNLYYSRHCSIIDDIRMLFATVLDKHMEYAGEII